MWKVFFVFIVIIISIPLYFYFAPSKSLKDLSPLVIESDCCVDGAKPLKTIPDPENVGGLNTQDSKFTILENLSSEIKIKRAEEEYYNIIPEHKCIIECE